MRAPDSFDLGGDGVVDQKEYFYATKFDANGDGDISQEERLTASQLMKSAATDLVFLSPRMAKFHKNAFSRYSQAVVPGHHTLQQHGAIMSEQLGGYAELTRSRLPGGKGPGGAVGAAGAHLPPDIADFVGETLLTGVSGASRFSGVEVDLDTSDNVVNLHTEGSKPDFDRVEVKTQFRPELYASGAKLRSELLAKRKAARVPSLTYDLDGDGAVSARDFFFAARQDRKGSHSLNPHARSVAASESRGEGMGSQFLEIRGDGAGQVGHRVQQSKGVVTGEQTPGGWAALTHNHMHGSAVWSGADGNLHTSMLIGKEEDGSGENGGIGSSTDVHKEVDLGKVLDSNGLTINGKVAMDTVAGSVTDYDTVTVKPHYRPALLSSGVKSVRELGLLRRLDKRPDPSFDLSGYGAVTNEDYQVAKRFDEGDKGYLTPAEMEKAQSEIALGLKDKFVRLSTGSSRGLSTRTFQRADGTVECEGADVVAGGREDPGYDHSVRLPTAGAVPALDLPKEIMDGTGLGGSLLGTSSNYLMGSNAHGHAKYSVFLKPVDPSKPYASVSIGAVPGVSRAIVRFPDGRQEAYGGYAMGLEAGGPTNVTGNARTQSPQGCSVEEAVLVSTAGGLEGLTSPRKGGAARYTLDGTSHGSIDFSADPPSQTQTTLRPLPTLAPEAPFRTHNQTTYCDPEDRGAVSSQAPYALMGVGSTGDGVVGWDTSMTLQRSTAPALGLRTATQLKAARKIALTGELQKPNNLVAATTQSETATLLFNSSSKVDKTVTYPSGSLNIAASASLGLFDQPPSERLPLANETTTTFSSTQSSTHKTAPLLAAHSGILSNLTTQGAFRPAASIPAAGAPSDPSNAPALAMAANTFTLAQTQRWLSSGSTVAGAAVLASGGSSLGATGGMGGSNSPFPPHGSTLADERARAYIKPTGESPVIDAIGSGAFSGGLTHLSTSQSQAVMPSHLNSHVIAAASVAQQIVEGTPGSPLFRGGSDSFVVSQGMQDSAAARTTAPKVETTLPEYMRRSMAASQIITVDPVELAPETIKPGALDASVRTLEATTASALSSLRKRDAYCAARDDFDAVDDLAIGSGAAPALPELYPPHFNDSSFTAAGKAVTLPVGPSGAPSLNDSLSGSRLTLSGISKTRSQLKARLRGDAIAASMPNAPTQVLGIHPAPLPSFSSRLNHKGVPWHKDTAALDTPLNTGDTTLPSAHFTATRGLTPARGVAGGETSYRAVVSALEGPAPPVNPAFADLPDNDRGTLIPPEYDAARRHSVRAPHLNGLDTTSSDATLHFDSEDLAATRASRPTLTPATIGAHNPRLIVDGLQREEECVGAASGAFDKVREVTPMSLGSWIRKHAGRGARDGMLTDKVTSVDVQAPGFTAAHFDNDGAPVRSGSPAGIGGSAFVASPVYTAQQAPVASLSQELFQTHSNVTSLGVILPGATPLEGGPGLLQTLLSSPYKLNSGNGSWSGNHLLHEKTIEGPVPPDALESDGKVTATPRDTQPLYSSFTSDKTFSLPYVTPLSYMPQPKTPSMKTLAAGVAATGGSVREGAPVTRFNAMPAQGVPGPEIRTSLKSPLPGDSEPRRGSVYGIEASSEEAGGHLRDVTVRGEELGKWGQLGGAARILDAQHSPRYSNVSNIKGKEGQTPVYSSSRRALPTSSTKYGNVRSSGFAK